MNDVIKPAGLGRPPVSKEIPPFKSKYARICCEFIKNNPGTTLHIKAQYNNGREQEIRIRYHVEHDYMRPKIAGFMEVTQNMPVINNIMCVYNLASKQVEWITLSRIQRIVNEETGAELITGRMRVKTPEEREAEREAWKFEENHESGGTWEIRYTYMGCDVLNQNGENENGERILQCALPYRVKADNYQLALRGIRDLLRGKINAVDLSVALRPVAGTGYQAGQHTPGQWADYFLNFSRGGRHALKVTVIEALNPEHAEAIATKMLRGKPMYDKYHLEIKPQSKPLFYYENDQQPSPEEAKV